MEVIANSDNLRYLLLAPPGLRRFQLRKAFTETISRGGAKEAQSRWEITLQSSVHFISGLSLRLGGFARILAWSTLQLRSQNG
jgi:hypothetical protein